MFEYRPETEISVTADDPTPQGIPMVNGKTRKPKHVLGKRKPRETGPASKCISHRINPETGERISIVFTRKQAKNYKTGIARDADGRWIITKDES